MIDLLTKKQQSDIDIVHELIRKDYVNNSRIRKKDLRKKKLDSKDLLPSSIIL